MYNPDQIGSQGGEKPQLPLDEKKQLTWEGQKDQPKEEAKKKIAFVDIRGAVEEQARDVAASRLTVEAKEFRGFTGFFKKIWHDTAYEGKRQAEVHRVKGEIAGTGNIFAGEADLTASNEAKATITERFLNEYDEAVHKEAGEEKKVLGEKAEEKAFEQKIKSRINDAIKAYARGALDEKNFQEEQNRIFSEVSGVPRDQVDKKVAYTSNLFEVARQAKQAFEHGGRLESLDFDFDVVVGKAKMGARTEAQFNACDRIVEKALNSRAGKYVGRFINEATLATGIGLVYSFAAATSGRLARSRIAAFGTAGLSAVAGGALAGMKESRRLELERAQHAREMAKGKVFNPKEAPRRKEMEEYRYETRNAGELTGTLKNALYIEKEGKREFRKDLTRQEFNAALTSLAEIESRIKLSDRMKVDLISYSDIKALEKERLEMDLLRAHAKVDLRKFAGEQGTTTLTKGKTFDEYFTSLSEARMEQFIKGDKGIEEKNRLFKTMKRKEVAKAAVKGVLIGLAVGTAVQELGAFISEKEGLVEGALTPNEAVAQEVTGQDLGVHHFTPLEYLRRYISGDLRMDSANLHEIVQGDIHIKLPEGADLVKTNGTFNLTRGGEVIAEHIQFNPDGTIAQESKEALAQKGILSNSILEHMVREEKKVITHPGKDITLVPKEFIEKNEKEGLFNAIKRDLWYDSDTPKPVFDKNELKLWWGGKGGMGIDEKGNYVFNIKHMMPDGSYHKEFSVDAQEAVKEGNKLKLLLSLSRDTQNQVIEVPIDANGNAVIDSNSEIGKDLFTIEDGKAKFLGRYAEVAEMMDKKEGADHVRILATHEGKGVEGMATHILGWEEVIAKPVEEDKAVILFEVPADYEVEAPWVIPVPGRIPLEPTGQIKPTGQKIEQKPPPTLPFEEKKGIPYQGGKEQLPWRERLQIPFWPFFGKKEEPKNLRAKEEREKGEAKPEQAEQTDTPQKEVFKKERLEKVFEAYDQRFKNIQSAYKLLSREKRPRQWEELSEEEKSAAKVLGIEGKETNEGNVKKAQRRLLKKWHSDRIAFLREVVSNSEKPPREQLERKDYYENSLDHALEALKDIEGIVELKKVPTIIIPDLHARREFLLKVLTREVSKDGKSVLERLTEGNINIVCLGDGMHSEVRGNWDPIIRMKREHGKLWEAFQDALKGAKQKRGVDEYASEIDADWEDPAVKAAWEDSGLSEQWKKVKENLMREEMARSLGLMQMVMELKARFPENFHFLRGNHDDMGERVESYYKFAQESKQVKQWITKNFGNDFLEKFQKFEDSLPLQVIGEGFVASHTAPSRVFTKEEIMKRAPEAVRGLTWTDNTKEETSEAFIDGTLANVGANGARWFVGHRNVDAGNYREQFGGKLIQINDDKRHIIAVVPTRTPFDPIRDIVEI